MISTPGKIIISGEYATLFGKPAIAMPVDLCVKTEISDIQIGAVPEIGIFSSELNYGAVKPINALQFSYLELLSRYNKFLQGHYDITEVLKHPAELVEFAVMYTLAQLGIKPATSLNIKIASDLPIGAGLGSSAAVAVSVVRNLAAHYNVQLEEWQCFKIGCDIERIQHGRTTGLDVVTICSDKCVYFCNEQIEIQDKPDINITIVHTGTPDVTTGQCVEYVQSRYGPDKTLWNEFAKVTSGIYDVINRHPQVLSQVNSEDRHGEPASSRGYTSSPGDPVEYNRQTALRPEAADNGLELLPLIQQNHRLLQRIGVVPEVVAEFIDEIERHSGAAKICGAGAVTGSKAGAVLVTGIAPSVITQIAAKYGFSVV